MELHHLGVAVEDVPAAVILLGATLALRVRAELDPVSVVERREFRSGLLARESRVLVCSGVRGAPSTVIALEELRRAGATTVVAMTSCECSACDHGVVVPRGAVRGEGTTASYAPDGFPAVPDHGLAASLRSLCANADTAVVHTVDVPPRWVPESPVAVGVPVDLESSAVLVAGAAGGMAAATLVVGSAADTDGLVDLVARAALARVAP